MAQAPSGLRFVRSVRRLQAGGVALELLDDGDEVVCDGRRLRRLRVRVRGEHRVAVQRRQIHQARPQLERRRDERRDELALPHAVHRHVDVIAAARRVQPPGDVLAARPDQQALDVEEQILARPVVRRGPDVAQ